MPNVDERLGSVEQRLEALAARMDEGFEQVDQRFERVDQRFEQVDQRFEQVDQRFEQVDQRFEQVDQRFAQVDRRFAQVDRRFDSLETEVHKLRVLCEQNTTDIQQIAELQAHHGQVHGAALQRIEKAIEPLKVLPAVIQNILPDHERRITALEKASPEHTRPP